MRGKLLLAIKAQWRETEADAVYAQPQVPIANTAGRSGRYTGTYAQLRLDYAFSRSTSFAVEAVHFTVGDALERAGGRDANYLGAQIAYGF